MERAGGRPNFWWLVLPWSWLVYFLGPGETGGMRPRTLICAAHHLRALCRLIIDLQFVLRSDLGTDLKSRTRLDQRSDTANHNIWWSNF